MLIRTVRMTFAPEKVSTFLELFEEASPHIEAFEGCHHLELWQDKRFPNIFTTYSHWSNNEALQHYRHSDLFESTWKRTKPLFAAPPVAVSYARHESSPRP